MFPAIQKMCIINIIGCEGGLSWMKKKNIPVQVLLLLFLTCGTAFSQTLALKANIGVCACWDAVGLNVYEICGLKVGTFSMIMHIICVLVQLAVQRKAFSLWKLLQIPYVILFGSILNFFFYDMLTFDLHSYGTKLLFVILAYVGLALFLGPLLLLNLVNMPSEAMCVVISGNYEIDYAKVRVSLDALCIIVSIVLSLAGGVSLKVREGTVIGMLMLGPLEKVSMNIFRPYIKKLQGTED
jgi:uncharacterized membrane protein YczE